MRSGSSKKRVYTPTGCGKRFEDNCIFLSLFVKTGKKCGMLQHGTV